MNWNNSEDIAVPDVVPPATEAAVRPRRARFLLFVIGAVLGSVLTSVVANLIIYPSLLKDTIHDYMAQREQPALPVPTQQTQKTATPEKPTLQLPATVTLRIKRGRTLGSILGEYDVGSDEVANLTESLRKVYNPRRMSAGQSMELSLDKSTQRPGKPIITGLTLKASAIRTIKVTREGDVFKTEAIDAPLVNAVAHGGGTINSSLYETGIHAGIPASMLAEIIKAFSYEVDFQRDIKGGDKLDVVYQRKQTLDGHTAGYGNILYASLTLAGKEKAIYRFQEKDGAAWYNKLGESIRKALLRTPINGARITSGFGMRIHPLMGYSKMHRGVDFGAPTGTPIYAAGDGTIAEAGRKGGYGNYVRIAHNKSYSTAYGHASRIARGIKPGTKVKQGQVIAYVGATGMATGPHLHYEVLINNAQVNPANVKFKYGQSLGGRELAQFKRQVKEVQVAIAKIPMNTALALNDPKMR